MAEDINKSVFDYASEKDRNANLLTFYSVYKVLLKGIDCIVCLESASDLLGYSNGGFRHQIYVYSTQELNLPYIKCFKVNDLKDIPYEEHKGIKVSPINVAIVDMLERDTTDTQILYETFAHYYCSNENSYNGLTIPRKLIKKANHFKKEGALFYEQ